MVIHQPDVKVLKFSPRYIPCGFIAEGKILIAKGKCIFKVGLCIYSGFVHRGLPFLTISVVKSWSNVSFMKSSLFVPLAILENAF